MSRLREDDPRSWLWAANTHGIPTGTRPRPSWSQCAHASWAFLPWHRAYLAWFEATIRRLTGDEEWRLPYWDHSVPGDRADRTMPVEFGVETRTVGGEVVPNPLYRAERSAAPIPRDDVGTVEALAHTRYVRRFPAFRHPPTSRVHRAACPPRGCHDRSFTALAGRRRGRPPHRRRPHPQPAGAAAAAERAPVPGARLPRRSGRHERQRTADTGPHPARRLLLRAVHPLQTSPTRPGAIHYLGTLRVHRVGATLAVSGDLYLRHVSAGSPDDAAREPDPADGIPVFPRAGYRYYLRATGVSDSPGTQESFTLTFELFRFNAAVTAWTNEGVSTVQLSWTTAPPGYPSGADYLTGDVRNSAGSVTGTLSLGGCRPSCAAPPWRSTGFRTGWCRGPTARPATAGHRCSQRSGGS